jgi:hypothetical protein
LKVTLDFGKVEIKDTTWINTPTNEARHRVDVKISRMGAIFKRIIEIEYNKSRKTALFWASQYSIQIFDPDNTNLVSDVESILSKLDSNWKN